MNRQRDLFAREPGAYRYELLERWDTDLPVLSWICLNPSTASEGVPDPTTRKIRGFCERWGWGGFYLVNLYPMRATFPRDLIAATEQERIGDPVEADRAIVGAVTRGQTVVAWGARGVSRTVRPRVAAVLKLLADRRPLPDLWCLGLTKEGTPGHPLMLAYSTPLVPFVLPSERT